MSPQLIEYLKISALVFFNLFCVLGIFLLIYLIIFLNLIGRKIRLLNDKLLETLDKSQLTLETIGEIAIEASDQLSGPALGMWSWLVPVAQKVFEVTVRRRNSCTKFFKKIFGK